MTDQEQQPDAQQEEETTLFERVGGGAFFVDLVDRFYERVAVDKVIRPLYPEDMEPGKVYLAAFLAQFWGGPPFYTAERGHPRLRARHFPFAIGQRERDAWVQCMGEAVADEVRAGAVTLDDAGLLMGYFEHAASVMVNQEPAEGP